MVDTWAIRLGGHSRGKVIGFRLTRGAAFFHADIAFAFWSVYTMKKD